MDDIHSCSYFCDRPACVKAQRDKLREILYERTWVGLTDEELFGLTDEMYSFAHHIEAKLKEKNNG